MKVSSVRTSLPIAVLVVVAAGAALSPQPSAVYAASSGCKGTAITSVGQLQNIGVKSTLPLTGTYCLTVDLNASATATWNGHSGFLPIAGNDYLHFERGFSGTLDGQGHVIRNLTIANSKTYGTGLIAVLQGTVRNLRLVNVHISGPYDVGGIAGDEIGGTIQTSSVTGIIAATRANGDSVGGVAGYVTNSTIGNSFSTAQVTIPTNTWAGGIAGYNIGGLIEDSYSTGRIRGAKGAVLGGFLGREDGPVTGSFWDVSTSKRAHGAGRMLCQCGTIRGLSDSQMREESIFSSAGWNFTSVWSIVNGKGYPALRAPTTAVTIPVIVALSAQVARGSTQAIQVTTTPNAQITMQVIYPQSGGITTSGTANAQGIWQYSWTVDASSAGTATVKLTVQVGGAIRHFTKKFAIT